MNKITARAIMEVLGTPESHVKDTAKAILDKIKENKNVELLKTHISNTKEAKIPDNKTPVKFYGCFMEVDIKLENVQRLIEFCFNFMPSSVDILEPTNLEIDARHLNNVLNDLMARLHKYDMFVKNLNAHASMLKKELDKKS